MCRVCLVCGQALPHIFGIVTVVIYSKKLSLMAFYLNMLPVVHVKRSEGIASGTRPADDQRRKVRHFDAERQRWVGRT